MVAYSSRLALRDLIADVDRHHNQRRAVYEAIKAWSGSYGPSREDLSKAIPMRLSSVCGRVNELLKEGIICKGPMKDQEVVPGRLLQVETLSAVVYRDSYHETESEQLSFL